MLDGRMLIQLFLFISLMQGSSLNSQQQQQQQRTENKKEGGYIYIRTKKRI